MPLKVVPKSSPIISWSSPRPLGELDSFRYSSNALFFIFRYCFAVGVLDWVALKINIWQKRTIVIVETSTWRVAGL